MVSLGLGHSIYPQAIRVKMRTVPPTFTYLSYDIRPHGDLLDHNGNPLLSEPWASTVYLRRLCVDPGVDPGVDPCRRPASTYVDPLGRRFYVCRRRPAFTCVDRRLSASTVYQRR